MWSISNFRIAILLLSCHEITEEFFAVEGAGNPAGNLRWEEAGNPAGNLRWEEAGNPAGNQVGGVLELILCDVGILSR